MCVHCTHEDNLLQFWVNCVPTALLCSPYCVDSKLELYAIKEKITVRSRPHIMEDDCSIRIYSSVCYIRVVKSVHLKLMSML